MDQGRHVELGGSDAPETRKPLTAHAAFFDENIKSIRLAMAQEVIIITSLTIVLPPAGSEHDAWRRAVAGDLAREYTPRRVNIAAGRKGKALDTLLTYLRDAPGVTGHYVQTHD